MMSRRKRLFIATVNLLALLAFTLMQAELVYGVDESVGGCKQIMNHRRNENSVPKDLSGTVSDSSLFEEQEETEDGEAGIAGAAKCQPFSLETSFFCDSLYCKNGMRFDKRVTDTYQLSDIILKNSVLRL